MRLHSSLSRGLHGSVAVCSAVGAEGSSMLAALLALRSAMAGKRTLLIDLNLKSATLTTTLGLSGQPWKISTAKSKNPLKNLATDLGEGWHGLHLLPVPTDAASIAILGNAGSLLDLLGSLKESYDHIWIDTTPIRQTNRGNIDALNIAASATRTAMVIKLRSTPATQINQALNGLLASGAHISGLIANNINNPSSKQLLISLCNALQPIMPNISRSLKARILHSDMV
jgi:polysaccharide biosynthesis transport protein